MTAQISDRFLILDHEYSEIAFSEPFAFAPREYGLRPGMHSTACWKGYWCVYQVTEDQILVKDLYIHTSDKHYPDINGVSVKKEDGRDFSYMGFHLYENVNIPVAYTGRILVGKDFKIEHYIHMGLQRPWAYETVLELVFDSGKLNQKIDHSCVSADIRAALTEYETPEQKGEYVLSDFAREQFFEEF